MLIVSNERIPDNGRIGINLRSVEVLDVMSLKVKVVDGRSRDPKDEMSAWEVEKRKGSQ